MTRRLRVAVLGATGVLGRPVVRQLLWRGHEVRAIVRSPDSAGLPLSPDLAVLPGDILDAASLAQPLEGCDAVLHLATAVPKPGSGNDWSLNDRIRREGTRNLLAAARRAGKPRYVQQSVAMLEADRVVPVLQSALEMEQLVQASALPWIVLRGGLFYGPGTGRTEDTERAAREGQLRLPGDGTGFVSLVRPDDMAEAVVLATEASVSGATLAIVDDRPVTWRELLGYVAELHGAPAPAPGGPVVLPGFRVSNEPARQVLGWRPRHPDYRSGWSAPL